MTYIPDDTPLPAPEGAPPRIKPRARYDLERARVLLIGIQYELANEHAFSQGEESDEATLELHQYMGELSEIVRRYHPYSALADDLEDD
jgi:hypothetical protein